MQQISRYRLSVIIPAYNKRAVLPETLAALDGQDTTGGYEVIVVDDGSTDGTLEWLRAQADIREGEKASYNYSLKVMTQANGGPAAARNAGVAAAIGELLLFLDADIIAAPGLLAAHCAGHERHPRSLVMGRVQVWPPAAGGPAYRIFGRSFDFGDQERALPPRFGITQNISITAADFAACGKFDASLPWGEDTEFVYRASAGFDPNFPRGQDIEFAYRLDARGLMLNYCPGALAFHNHPLSLDDLCRKARKDHRLLVSLFVRHPEILADLDYLQDKLPVAWGRDSVQLVLRKAWRAALAAAPARAALRAACAALERRWPSPLLLDFLVWKLVGAYQWLGLREGMAEYGWRPHAEF